LLQVIETYDSYICENGIPWKKAVLERASLSMCRLCSEVRPRRSFRMKWSDEMDSRGTKWWTTRIYGKSRRYCR